VFKKIILAVSILLITATAQAEPIRYVNDEIVITLRAGQGDEYRIIRTLKTGTAMDLLEEQEVFSRVKLNDGTEGWVRNQYIVSEPIARIKLVDLTEVLAKLQIDHKNAQKLFEEAAAERDALLNVRKELEKQNLHLAQENAELEAIAARPMEIERHNNELMVENQRLAAEHKQASEENESLRNSTVQKWFLVGAGVLLLGLIAGLFLPKIGNRRRSSW